MADKEDTDHIRCRLARRAEKFEEDAEQIDEIIRHRTASTIG